MYLVGGSERSLLFNTSSKITGYEPGVNSINHFFFTLSTITERLLQNSHHHLVYSICLSISAAARAISRKLILPLFETRASRKTPRRLSSNTTEKHPRYITMSIFKIQPQHCLNSVNYMCWKNLVRTALEKVEAFDIATGTETYPQTGGSASAIQAKQRDYRKRAATRLEVIQAACTPGVTTHIDHLHDLREVWEALRLRFYTKDSDEVRMTIRTSFDRCTLKDDEKVLFVLNLLFVTRYMRPKGPWQRLCRCPLKGQ